MLGERKHHIWDWRAIGLAAAITGIATIAALAVYWFDLASFDAVMVEDGPAESVSAILYFASFLVLAFTLVRRRSLNVWVILLALLFFVVAGEEISWGQRIIGAETPDLLRQANVQGETNIHNIDGIHQHVRGLAVVLLVSLYVLLPAANAFAGLRSLIERLRIPVPPLWIGLIALFALAFMVVPRALGRNDFSLDEMGELYFSVAAIGFALSLARGAGTDRPAAA